MPLSAEPFGKLQTATVRGRRMAYIDEGEGETVVFQHGNPTSSYLWRNVMPHCQGLGRRLVACDLIGMGQSDKLSDSGPDRYTYAEQRDHLFDLWEKLALGDRIVLVLHDWGSALGFDWAARHPERIAGICYMEALITPLTREEWSEPARALLRDIRSPAGEALVLEQNLFIERFLPNGILRSLSEAEMEAYRTPFLHPGEARRPTLTWPRQIPIEGEPADVVSVVAGYGEALAQSMTPKLFINADPGSILIGRRREVCRAWPNQTEITVAGRHFVQEDSPDQIGRAVADFVRRLDDLQPDELKPGRI